MRKPTIPILVLAWLFTFSASGGEPAASPPAFPKGTLSFQTYGTYSGGLGKYTNTESAAAGVGYYVFDNFSLSLEASGYRAQQSAARDAWMYGVAGVLRHHVIQFDRTTIFFDATFGPVEATARVPGGGTYFNYITRTGIGATFLLKDHTYLIGGARYFHLSNARIEGPIRNPSINGVEGFVGIMWTF
jgi:hypothetical protein